MILLNLPNKFEQKKGGKTMGGMIKYITEQAERNEKHEECIAAGRFPADGL